MVEDHSHDHDEENADGHDDEHGHHRHDVDRLDLAVLSVSSTRTVDDDPAGDVVVEAAEKDGHEVAVREVVEDDYDRIQSRVGDLADGEDVDAVLTTGGTGVTPDDVTVEAVEGLFEKSLPGFGELFRRFSYDEVGTRVVGTRATAGIVDGTPVFSMPGSENAARLGIESVVLPEAGHLVGLATRN
jgi:molybdenum cofactor biosynthesis protein B